MIAAWSTAVGAPLRHQEVADLDPGGEVVAQPPVVRVQPREVDDAADPGIVGGLPEGARQVPVALDEVALAVHGVQEVVGDVDAGEGPVEGLPRGGVTLDDLDPVAPPAVGDLRVVPGEGAHPPALLEEAGDEPRADVARDAGDEGQPAAGSQAVQRSS